MMQLPEMLRLVGRLSGLLGLICSLVAIVLGMWLLLKEDPALALGVSLSVIGLIVAILNLASKKGGSRRKRSLEIDLSKSFAYDDLELAFHGVTSALALLGDMGYMGGDIYEGLSRAAAFFDACIKDAQKGQNGPEPPRGKWGRFLQSVENALRHGIPPEGTGKRKDTEKMQTMTLELDRQTRQSDNQT